MSKKKFRGYPVHRVHHATPEDDSLEWLIWAAWSDRFTFEEIEERLGMTEGDVIRFMQQNQSSATFRRWRRRVRHSSYKHGERFKASRRVGRFSKYREEPLEHLE